MPLLANSDIPKLQNKKSASIRIDKFDGGSNLQLSETRLKKEEARVSDDLMLIEDGIWDKRWGTKQYGPSFTAIDGFTDYKKSDGTTELIVIDNGTAYRVTSSSKTAITGASFTAGYQCFFLQIGTYLYIGNGTDFLTRYDGSTLARYTALDTPTWDGTPIARGAGLSAGTFTYYYRVTAVNAVGETIASSEQSITVNKDRDTWVLASNEYVTLGWADVAGALKYIIYFSDVSGYEVKLAEVTTSTYQDTGADTPNPYIEPPTNNTTGGPKLKQMWLNSNRIWGVEPDNMYRTYFSGSGVNQGNFAPGFGGGWIDLEKGGKATVVCGCDFQGKSHVICRTDNGRGTVWQVALESQVIGDESVIVPIPNKILGAIGTDAPLSLIAVENDYMFMNKKQMSVLGNEPGILNVIRGNEVSQKIRPYVTSITSSKITSVCAYYYDAKVFFSVNTGTSSLNNRIICYDRERLVPVVAWTVGVSQFGEFTESDGTTKLLGAAGTKLIEFSPAYQSDNGTAFTPTYVSPRIPVSDDWTQFAKIKRAFVRLRNVTGSISFSFSGTQKAASFSSLATSVIAPGTSDTGMGWDLMGSVKIGTTSGVPTAFAQESLIKFLVINKLIRDLQYTIKTNGGVNDRFVLTGLKAEGFLVPTGAPSDWKLSTS